MSNNEDSGHLKKRKKDGHGSNVEASPVKTSKLDRKSTIKEDDYSPDGSKSSINSSQDSGKSTIKEDDYSPDGSKSSINSSQDSASSSQQEGSSQSSTQSQSSQGMGVQKDKKENDSTLALRCGNVFTKLIEVFSEENPPGKITYNGNGYNLTELYDEFWTEFFNSQYSRGNRSKLPQAQSATDLELRSMAKIIKRGWEDERYWPKQFSPPFLECCLFQGGLSEQILTGDMFLEFIEPSEKSVIQNLSNVDQKVLAIFKKYCCENIVHIGEDIRDSCINAANKIMIVDMRPVIDIWSQSLSGIMPINTFNFLMKESFNLDLHHIKDMHDYSPPHKLWHTFFLSWPEDKVEYYKRLLRNDKFGDMCHLCSNTYFTAKHFISVCEMTNKTTRLERHDAVLRQIEIKLNEAIERGSPYFPKGTEWKIVTMYGNEFYDWPIEDLGVSFEGELYPHMLVYSLSPAKRILVIELTISWEYNMNKEEKSMSRKYDPVRVALKNIGFAVEYQVIVLGSRGVLVPKLYDLLEQICGMEHSEISQTLEEISREIVCIHYESYKKEKLG